MVIFLHTWVKYGPFLDPLAYTATVYRYFIQQAYVYIYITVFKMTIKHPMNVGVSDMAVLNFGQAFGILSYLNPNPRS